MSKVDKEIVDKTPKVANKSPKGFFRVKEAVPEDEPEPDYYEINLPEVNYIENILQTRTVFS